jgi:hypothetical protein
MRRAPRTAVSQATLVVLALVTLVACGPDSTDPTWWLHSVLVKNEMGQLLHDDGGCRAARHLLTREFDGWRDQRYPYHLASSDDFDSFYFELKQAITDHGCRPPALDEGLL